MDVESLAAKLRVAPTVARKAAELVRMVSVKRMAGSAPICHAAVCVQLAAQALGTPLDQVLHSRGVPWASCWGMALCHIH